MKRNSFFAFLFFLGQSIHADPADPAKVDSDYAIQGEYHGVVKGMDGDLKLGCQVVAMGKGSFMARGYVGGLPGDGWNRTMEETVQSLKKDDGSLIFENDKHRGILKAGVIEVETLDGAKMGVLKKVDRKSPTLGAKMREQQEQMLNSWEVWNFDPEKSPSQRYHIMKIRGNSLLGVVKTKWQQVKTLTD